MVAKTPPDEIGRRWRIQWDDDGVWAKGELSGGWEAHFVFEFSDDKPIAREIAVRPGRHAPPADGIPATVLREIPLSEAIGVVQRTRLRHKGKASGEVIERAAAKLDKGASSRRHGPAIQHGDLHYAELAQAYVEVASTLRKPYAALAERFGYAEPTLRQKIVEARTRKLLTNTRQGAAGGELTAKAKRLLSEKA